MKMSLEELKIAPILIDFDQFELILINLDRFGVVLVVFGRSWLIRNDFDGFRWILVDSANPKT